MTVINQPEVVEAPALARLADLAAGRDVRIGAAVDMAPLDGGDMRYASVLAREFNLVVAENAYKAYLVWTGPREYDFRQTDRLAEFARQNGMAIRGHTLLWHRSVPRWLAQGGYSGDTVREMLKEYVTAFVTRYRGVVTDWDVVNEAIDDGEQPSLREDSFWFRALGPDYLDDMFRWAHAADPGARLYYNDYEIEDVCPKSDAVYRLLAGMLERGVPLHGIGLQGHMMNGWRLTAAHRENVRRFVALGLEWQVTEADVRIELNGRPPTEAQLADQAAAFGDLAELCLTEPGCRGLITWGFTDAHSWIPGFRLGWGAALLLDEEYRPKPAYVAIADALRGRGPMSV